MQLRTPLPGPCQDHCPGAARPAQGCLCVCPGLGGRRVGQPPQPTRPLSPQGPGGRRPADPAGGLRGGQGRGRGGAPAHQRGRRPDQPSGGLRVSVPQGEPGARLRGPGSRDRGPGLRRDCLPCPRRPHPDQSRRAGSGAPAGSSEGPGALETGGAQSRSGQPGGKSSLAQAQSQGHRALENIVAKIRGS